MDYSILLTKFMKWWNGSKYSFLILWFKWDINIISALSLFCYSLLLELSRPFVYCVTKYGLHLFVTFNATLKLAKKGRKFFLFLSTDGHCFCKIQNFLVLLVCMFVCFHTLKLKLYKLNEIIYLNNSTKSSSSI